ncbi:unnamed protein product [Ceutorhynchus assimilis]|nr:unnamed protein product [Ceutorhynchus assimilis]
MALKYLIVLSIVCLTNSELVNTNNTKEHSNLRKRDVNSYVGLVACAMKYDMPCFIDVAQDYLENRRTDLLAQADAQMLESGRSDPDSKPSHLADTLTKLISEITDMFQNGFSGIFDAGREAADDEESDLEKNETEMTTTGDSNGETRELNKSGSGIKKKKKKPLKSLIRLIKVGIVAVIIVLKLSVVLKVLQTAMQFKFMLISLGGFVIQAAKLWMSVRNKKDMHGHEEIVYKSPYGTDAEYSSPPGGAVYGTGDYNARSGQDMAYASQRSMM